MKIQRVLTAFCVTVLVALAGTVPAPEGQAETVASPPTQTAPSAIKPVAGISIPDTKMARDAAQLIRDSEGELLFQHSTRVYYWAALAGKRKGLTFDPELLYVAAMFHDFGLTAAYKDSHFRYEVDGANAARDFLRSHGVSDAESMKVWLAIALHTTNGISPHLFPVASLVAEGANMDLVGAGYDDFTTGQRNAVEAAHPHPPQFAEDFMQALYDSLKHRPETTQGTGLADVMVHKNPHFVLRDFSSLMNNSHWATGK